MAEPKARVSSEEALGSVFYVLQGHVHALEFFWQASIFIEVNKRSRFDFVADYNRNSINRENACSDDLYLKGLTAIHKIMNCTGHCIHLQLFSNDLSSDLNITDKKRITHQQDNMDKMTSGICSNLQSDSIVSFILVRYGMLTPSFSPVSTTSR